MGFDLGSRPLVDRVSSDLRIQGMSTGPLGEVFSLFISPNCRGVLNKKGGALPTFSTSFWISQSSGDYG